MNNNNTNPLYQDPQQQVSNPLEFNESVLQIADPLALDISDEDLGKIVKDRVEASEKFFEEKYNLKARRRKNEKYLFGRQIAELEDQGKLKDYETRSNDNALYEIEASLKPLAMSKLPDIIVTAGSDNDAEKQESADNLTIAIDDTNKQRDLRQVMGLAFKHLPAYFTAVIKTRWNADRGIDGDFEFININPEYVVVDHTATSKNVDDMAFVAQCTPMTVQELIMKFPSKKQDIIDKLKIVSIQAGVGDAWKDLASEVKPWEVWFDWYKKKGTQDLMSKADALSIDEPGIKWERVAGVCWRLDDLILDKMLDPNFDHEGEEKLFTYAVPGDETTKQEVDPQQLLMGMLQGQPMPNISKEKIYHNYFSRPHKPFYFFGYDQWGKVAYDETSRIEQNIRNQENLDEQNKTILDQIKTRVKHIWGADSGLRKADIQRLDMDDPKMDVRVEGNPNEVHAAVLPERPDAAQFNALQDTRSRMYAISGSTAVRGQVQSSVATSNQIAREADFTRSDDLVEDTVNAAYEWVSEWQMQFIKLRYTEDHMRQILGSKGQMTYIRLRGDMISEGMEVMIKASSTDKLKAQRNAMDTAQLGAPFTNPLDFFKDMDMNDPEGRTERGIMFATDPQGYFTKYILNLDTTAQQVGAITPNVPGAVPPGGAPPQPGTPQGQPQNPSAQNTSAVPMSPPTGPPQGSPRGI